MSKDYYDPGGRRDRNERSRNAADNNQQVWESEDDAFIREFWMNDPHRDEQDVASALGRTIEACRNRAQHLRAMDSGQQVRRVTQTRTVTTTTTTDYIGADDDPEDRWWEGKQA